jgi:uncharacterized protein YkwD
VLAPRRARSVALLTATTLALLAGPLVQPALASVSASYENSAISHTNSERAQRDRVNLKKSNCLGRFAERQARAMAASRTLHHQPMRPILDACQLSQVGENVAFGYPSGTAVVDAWMHSADHQQNLLNSRHRMIGLGAYQDAEGYWYVSEVLGRKL